MLWSVYMLESVPLLFALQQNQIFFIFDGTSAICDDN